MKLEMGQHVVVGTPGRVFDMISRRALGEWDVNGRSSWHICPVIALDAMPELSTGPPCPAISLPPLPPSLPHPQWWGKVRSLSLPPAAFCTHKHPQQVYVPIYSWPWRYHSSAFVSPTSSILHTQAPPTSVCSYILLAMEISLISLCLSHQQHFAHTSTPNKCMFLYTLGHGDITHQPLSLPPAAFCTHKHPQQVYVPIYSCHGDITHQPLSLPPAAFCTHKHPQQVYVPIYSWPWRYHSSAFVSPTSSILHTQAPPTSVCSYIFLAIDVSLISQPLRFFRFVGWLEYFANDSFWLAAQICIGMTCLRVLFETARDSSLSPKFTGRMECACCCLSLDCTFLPRSMTSRMLALEHLRLAVCLPWSI